MPMYAESDIETLQGHQGRRLEPARMSGSLLVAALLPSVYLTALPLRIASRVYLFNYLVKHETTVHSPKH